MNPDGSNQTRLTFKAGWDVAPDWQPIPKHPIGGMVTSVNKYSILAPYIALIGLIGAISTIFAIRRWRKD